MPDYSPHPDFKALGAIGQFTGINIYRSYYLERGRVYMGVDPARQGHQCVFAGVGLLRGVAYTAPGVERGYVVTQPGTWCELLDVTTGKIVTVIVDDAVEVEERYRAEPLIGATRGHPPG